MLIFNEEYRDRSGCCSWYEIREKDMNADGDVNREINHDNGNKEKEKATILNNKRKRTES